MLYILDNIAGCARCLRLVKCSLALVDFGTEDNQFGTAVKHHLTLRDVLTFVIQLILNILLTLLIRCLAILTLPILTFKKLILIVLYQMI